MPRIGVAGLPFYSRSWGDKKYPVCSIDKDVHSHSKRYLVEIEQGLISLSVTSACVIDMTNVLMINEKGCELCKFHLSRVFIYGYYYYNYCYFFLDLNN